MARRQPGAFRPRMTRPHLPSPGSVRLGDAFWFGPITISNGFAPGGLVVAENAPDEVERALWGSFQAIAADAVDPFKELRENLHDAYCLGLGREIADALFQRRMTHYDTLAESPLGVEAIMPMPRNPRGPNDLDPN